LRLEVHVLQRRAAIEAAVADIDAAVTAPAEWIAAGERGAIEAQRGGHDRRAVGQRTCILKETIPSRCRSEVPSPGWMPWPPDEDDEPPVLDVSLDSITQPSSTLME
jgi:hypothetical protein